MGWFKNKIKTTLGSETLEFTSKEMKLWKNREMDKLIPLCISKCFNFQIDFWTMRKENKFYKFTEDQIIINKFSLIQNDKRTHIDFEGQITYYPVKEENAFIKGTLNLIYNSKKCIYFFLSNLGIKIYKLV